jgi:tyrosyl-tRNA synthetase
MDSVAINSDVELGGTDQKFNLLVGREIQRAYNVEPQVILTMPLLEGTDGREKMSKSLNNYIALTEVPREMFGKVMSIPDEMIARYFRYAGQAPEVDCVRMEQGLKDGSAHPRNAKVETAMRIIELYNSKEAGQAALEEFERIFKNKDVPDEIEEQTINVDNPVQSVLDVLAMTNLAPSKKEAKRLIEQGGVSIDGEKVSDYKATADFTNQRLIKVGKRKFLKVTANP